MGTKLLSLKVSAFLGACLMFFSLSAAAKEVTIGMGNFEPYYIGDDNTGIFTDLIIAVFDRLPDHEPKFIFGRPNNRLWQDFKNGRVDAVSNLFDTVEIDGCRSDPIFRFRDVAVTRKSSNITIESVQDLEGQKIIAFQGAKDFFGPEFSEVVGDSNYSEASEPRLQAQALNDNRVDVSVGDLFIFLHSIKNTQGSSADAKDFKIHDILPVVFSRMGFWNYELCREFNKALQDVKDSGEYEMIYDRYLQELGHNTELNP
ncbi:substrate-binding periplasmic protein [Kiloniella sp.]|uniref:substrate-binding periplasmic protein n=1 Tax=Kiloniella sp. TaxID=1938587 RepID=UPI003B0115C9